MLTVFLLNVNGIMISDVTKSSYGATFTWNAAGLLHAFVDVEQDAYLAYGDRLSPSAMTLKTDAGNRYRFNGKEREDWVCYPYIDYGARMYNPVIGSWLSPDPLADKYTSTSPYVFCAGDPVNYVDPDGLSTQVYKTTDSTYVVTSYGNQNDGDLNIYVGYYDSNGKWIITSETIGVTATAYSFYNSDENEWMEGAVINTKDTSGKSFFKAMRNARLSLGNYASNAGNFDQYDFKSTNGTPCVIYSEDVDYYRGMPLSDNSNGQTVYASARDVGNIVAGYYAAVNGFPWSVTRTALDEYQGSPEGLSSQMAQLDGWRTGQKLPLINKAINFCCSIPTLYKIIKKTQK